MKRKSRPGGFRSDDAWSFPPSVPIAVRGGIKAQNTRGAFGTQWWGKRWMLVLETLSLGSRLQRGRAYARSGQVVDLHLERGRVTATIQGSRPQPYRATIEVATLDAPSWRRVLDAIAADSRFAAKLVTGEMPQEIETAFESAGASLFPRSARDLKTACSCPDASNPCKHLAAVYYLLGEEFDRDPFLLFRLRGCTKDELLGALERPAGFAEEPPADILAPASDDDLEQFWSGNSCAPVLSASCGRSARRVVPPLAFWRGEEPLPTVLANIDERAGIEAERLLGELQ